jgi:hypothetical protein
MPNRPLSGIFCFRANSSDFEFQIHVEGGRHRTRAKAVREPLAKLHARCRWTRCSPSPQPSPSGRDFPETKFSRIEPMNLLGWPTSVVGAVWPRFPLVRLGFPELPAGEIGSGRRQAYCLVTPLLRCSRWGGLSFKWMTGHWPTGKFSKDQYSVL